MEIFRHFSITTGSRCAAEWRRSSSPTLRSRLVRPQTSVPDSLPDEAWRITRLPATFRAVSRGPAEAEQPQIPGGGAKVSDFQAFVDLLSEAKLRRPMRVLAFCVMPNHFHLALWPLGDAVGSADCIHFGTSVLPQTTRQPSPGTTSAAWSLRKESCPCSPTRCSNLLCPPRRPNSLCPPSATRRLILISPAVMLKKVARSISLPEEARR